MGMHYIRKAGANRPGNPGKPRVGVKITNYNTGAVTVYRLEGVKGTKVAFTAVRKWLNGGWTQMQVFKTQAELDAAIAIHVQHGALRMVDGELVKTLR